MAQVIQAKFSSRPRDGDWMFDVHFVAAMPVRHISKSGRNQADALTQVIDELSDEPEVKRIDCTPLAADAVGATKLQGDSA